MKKILLLLLLSVGMLLASINLNTATKGELMSIKGVGDKKSDQIIKYRKTNSLNSADDLKNIKGFGPALINNVKKDVKTKGKSKKNVMKSKNKDKKEEMKTRNKSKKEEMNLKKSKMKSKGKKEKKMKKMTMKKDKMKN